MSEGQREEERGKGEGGMEFPLLVWGPPPRDPWSRINCQLHMKGRRSRGAQMGPRPAAHREGSTV